MRLDLLIDDMHLLWVLGMKVTVQGGPQQVSNDKLVLAYT